MRYVILLTILIAITSCSIASKESINNKCLGNTAPPASLTDSLRPIENYKLTDSTIGLPLNGKLCQAQAYQAPKSFWVYRAWNSSKPMSKIGNWWTFSKPETSKKDYRSKYEICKKWSSLDMLVRCKVKKGVKIIIGTGQSEQCARTTYPVSPAKQIYISIDELNNQLTNCSTWTAQWEEHG